MKQLQLELPCSSPLSFVTVHLCFAGARLVSYMGPWQGTTTLASCKLLRVALIFAILPGMWYHCWSSSGGREHSRGSYLSFPFNSSYTIGQGTKVIPSTNYVHSNFISVIRKVGFPGSSAGKESACNAGDPGSVAGSWRSPEGGHDNPLQYSCLENPMDRGLWRAAVHGVTKSQT